MAVVTRPGLGLAGFALQQSSKIIQCSEPLSQGDAWLVCMAAHADQCAAATPMRMLQDAQVYYLQ
jgi:hypothetical protein